MSRERTSLCHQAARIRQVRRGAMNSGGCRSAQPSSERSKRLRGDYEAMRDAEARVRQKNVANEKIATRVHMNEMQRQ